MTIYFLQRLNPPVLPVLHELLGPKKPSRSAKVSMCKAGEADIIKASPKTEPISPRKKDSDDSEDSSSDLDELSDVEEVDEKNRSENFEVFQRKLHDYVRKNFK